MTHLVVGLGEVGQAIQEVFRCQGIDKGEKAEGEFDIIHICIPYSKDFVKQVKEYQKRYQPKYTVVHSTVQVGTSRKLNAIHSPIRGLHPNLYEGIMTFPKFLGGEASGVADEFRRCGLKVILFDKSETTELGKLLDTEYYRACIEFTLRAKKLCDEKNVPFSEAYTLFNLTYNEGYTQLGHSEYVRPTLQPIMKTIGGHCLLPNKEIIKL